MQRMVNMVIGLGVVTGVAVVLLGSIGGKSSSGWNSGSSRTGIEGLEMAGPQIGPTIQQPPPFPSEARLPVVPAPLELAALLANPGDPPAALIEARWKIARRRLDKIFGSSLSDDKREAIDSALMVWLKTQLANLAAYHGGYIDRTTLGLHAAWARQQYVATLKAVLGAADYERYAAGVALDEINPKLP